jgi:transcriptional regulator of arginine metabolism
VPNEIEVRDERQRAILAILRRSSVRRQEELVHQLGARGFPVTQSSVSRDLRDLGVAKLRGRYLPPAAPGAAAVEELEEVAHYLRAVAPAGPYLTVVSTQVGAAQAVGVGLDRAGWPEIVGTIAGDDTVFVATAASRDQTRLLHRLRALLAAQPEPTTTPRPARPVARTAAATSSR